MRYGSVCSGIEAAFVAWEPLGFSPAWLSEIEPFPCAVLAHRLPDVPNLGDMRTIAARVRSGEVEAPDLFCGGTPCQAFSVAGRRQSLDDERGVLSLVFCELADAIDEQRKRRGQKPADQCPDSPRYRAIGNSWAVPVVRWIGRRIKNELEKKETQ